MTVLRVFAALAACLALCPAPTARAGELEVFHSWNLAGDARAIAFLKATLTQQGDTWRDFAVAGGGNGTALTQLKSRVAAGNPPTAAQMKAPAIAAWAQAGQLADLDDIARSGQWDQVIPEVISARMKYKGHYVAVPVNIHRDNWLWINSRVLKASRARTPTTWDEFFRTAEQMKRAGFIAVAHGGQPREDLRLFESVVVGLSGAEFYRKALVQLDRAALSSAAMARALATFRRIKSYTDRSHYRSDWIQASAMLTGDKAGMQFMGDWNKPVLMDARKTANFEFECVPVPGATGAFVFDVDSFVMFKVKGEAKLSAQRHLASALLRPEIQERLNLYKGALPVRSDVDLGRYDGCATSSKAAFLQALQTDTLVPSINMSLPPPVEEAMRDIISDFWRDDRVTPSATIARLKALAPGS